MWLGPACLVGGRDPAPTEKHTEAKEGKPVGGKYSTPLGKRGSFQRQEGLTSLSACGHVSFSHSGIRILDSRQAVLP